jgi:hypothetical protein
MDTPAGTETTTTTGRRTYAALRVVAVVAAWCWTVLAGGGGFVLLLVRGPLPLTNGWFALFSGLAACLLLPGLIRRLSGRAVRWRVCLAVAAAIIVAGRITLLVEGPRPPPPPEPRPENGVVRFLLG